MRKLLLFGAFILFGFNISGQVLNGLVAHFSFDNTFSDSSPSGIVATNNGCSFSNDRNGTPDYAITLDGNSNYVAFNDNAVKVPLPITIATWVNLKSIGGFTAHIIFSSDNPNGGWSGYGMHVIPSGQVVLSLGQNQLMSSTTVSNNAWHHIVGIIRGPGDMSIYLDCNDVSGNYSGSSGQNPVYTTAESRIGSFSNGSVAYYLDGSIDDLAIWDRELSASEIDTVCDISVNLSLNELNNASPKKVVSIIDLLGRETENRPNMILIYIYSDGTREKVYRVE